MDALEYSRDGAQLQLFPAVIEKICRVCAESKLYTEFPIKRYRGGVAKYDTRCKACKSRQVMTARKGRMDLDLYEAEHGFTVAACGKWCWDIGRQHTPRDPETIEAFKLFRARKALISTLRRIRDSKPKPVTYQPVDQAKVWAFYNDLGRLTEQAAWKDWTSSCRLQWFIDNQVKAPPVCFENESKRFSFNYRHIRSFAIMERNRRRLREKLRGKIWKSIDNGVYNSTRRHVNDSLSLRKYVKYTSDELRKHIEKQFTDAMCWERMAEIHIDHIVPCSAFDMSDDAEVVACWALVNLRPMWAKENILKSANIDYSAISDELRTHLKRKAPRVHSIIFENRFGAFP